MDDALATARECWADHRWREACDGFLAADPEDLQAADLERLAVASYLVGRNAESDDSWTRAHRLSLDRHDVPGAVRCAFWLAFRLLNAHDQSSANGWIARIQRIVDEKAAPAEGARLAYLTGLRAVFDGELDHGERDLGTACEFATRAGDHELAALARLALGRVLIFGGRPVDGTRLIDEAMLAIGEGNVSPIAVGDGYCTAIDACYDLVDIVRGQAWTDELARWCGMQPDLVPFAGACQVHQAEFLQLKGAWVEALDQAARARERLSTPFRQLAYGAAVYQLGELHRLRGKTAAADACYREAGTAGRDPQPGLALLRLSEGHTQEAAHAVGRALAEAQGLAIRSRLLPAAVEVMLAVGQLADAQSAAEELAEMADALGSPMLAAISNRCGGAVMLAQGDPGAALPLLRCASDAFRELQAPYDLARTGVLLGTARQLLGDLEGARLEIDGARTIFDRLGAAPDLAQLEGERSHTLTARELQVLRLVACGSTNRSIGTELGISSRTVDRHLSNIFAKLGVGSRAEAIARGYESDLL